MSTLEPLASFRVLGIPAPQGSKTAVQRGGRAHLIEGGSTTGRQKHRAWREAVAWQAISEAPSDPHDGPLYLGITFRLPMPQTRKAAVRRAGCGWHSVKPDIDKLIRSTLDGLTTAGLIADDARVCEISAEAVEVSGWTGAEIDLARHLGEPELKEQVA